MRWEFTGLAIANTLNYADTDSGNIAKPEPDPDSVTNSEPDSGPDQNGFARFAGYGRYQFLQRNARLSPLYRSE